MDRPCQYIAPFTGERCNAQPAKRVPLGFSWQVPNAEQPGRFVTFYASRLCAEHKAFADEHRRP